MSELPMPWMPPKSTQARLDHFDDYAYKGTPDTILYKLMDALCGTTGAGYLLNQAFLSRLNAALDTIYYNELDYIFGNFNFLSRAPEESYSFSPLTDLMTTAQWDEARVKDAWYRARIRDFWVACGLGGTPDGIRMGVHAAISSDCYIYEVWRYLDSFGLTTPLGRAPSSARNEVVIQPHKQNIDPGSMRLLRDMLDRYMPADVIVTVDPNGLAVAVPVSIAAAASDSVYYEVIKGVTPTPLLDQIPPPEFLPVNMNDSEQWLFKKDEDGERDEREAPTAAFSSTSQWAYYYLSNSPRSPIDGVSYGTLNEDGSTTLVADFQVFDRRGEFTDWLRYELADSPDNYPGGKFGKHPAYAPAFNPDGSEYRFQYTSQDDYITIQITEIEGLGGIADHDHYRLPISAPGSSAAIFYPEYALAVEAPPRDCTVHRCPTRERGRAFEGSSARDTRTFVRIS